METVKIVIIKGLLYSQLIFSLEMQHLGVRTEQLCCLLRNFAPIAIQTFKNSPCGTKRQTVQSIREATKMQHFFRVFKSLRSCYKNWWANSQLCTFCLDEAKVFASKRMWQKAQTNQKATKMWHFLLGESENCCLQAKFASKQKYKNVCCLFAWFNTSFLKFG